MTSNSSFTHFSPLESSRGELFVCNFIFKTTMACVAGLVAKLVMLLEVCACFFFLLRVNFVEGLSVTEDTPFAGFNVRPERIISVDPSQKQGNFTTIQSAIDSVPSGNTKWVCIYIKKGTYREKVKIPSDKPYIILKGQSRRTTEIVWDDHENLAQSPTFTSLADNIVVKSISFRNAYNNPVNQKNPRVPAAAARSSGDKSYFHRCGFYGLQDTLWDDEGRHYFKRCTIQGAVDFIFGAGQSVYEECSISVLGGALGPGIEGIITAQGRTDPNDSNGFVFKGCKVSGTGTAVLGRPWRAYARVLFYNSNFTSVVSPKGWEAGSFSGHEDKLTFSEYNCYGEGASTSQRVTWEKKLSWSTVKQLASRAYVDSDGWLNDQPY